MSQVTYFTWWHQIFEVQYMLNMTHLAPRILKCLLDFYKICGPLALKSHCYQTKQRNLNPKFIWLKGSRSPRCRGISCYLRSPNVEGLVFWDVILSLGKWLLKFQRYKVPHAQHGGDTGNVICTLKVLLEKLHISIKVHLNSLLQITQLQCTSFVILTRFSTNYHCIEDISNCKAENNKTGNVHIT
jgi:hypothetical protein